MVVEVGGRFGGLGMSEVYCEECAMRGTHSSHESRVSLLVTHRIGRGPPRARESCSFG
jgi:hypothetical protein